MLGVVLLLVAVVMTVAEVGGGFALALGGCGSAMLLLGIAVNARVADEMIHSGRR